SLLNAAQRFQVLAPDLGQELKTFGAETMLKAVCDTLQQAFNLAFDLSFDLSSLLRLFQSDPLDTGHVWRFLLLRKLVDLFRELHFQLSRQRHHPVDQAEELSHLFARQAAIKETLDQPDLPGMATLGSPARLVRLEVRQHDGTKDARFA